MQLYTIYWNNGRKEVLRGSTLFDSLIRAGYQIIKTEDIYDFTSEEKENFSFMWDKIGNRWVTADSKDPIINLKKEIACGNFCGTKCTVCGGAGNLCTEMLILRNRELTYALEQIATASTSLVCLAEAQDLAKKVLNK